MQASGAYVHTPYIYIYMFMAVVATQRNCTTAIIVINNSNNSNKAYENCCRMSYALVANPQRR